MNWEFVMLLGQRELYYVTHETGFPPFDLALLRVIQYKVDSSGKPDQQTNDKAKEELKNRLIKAQKEAQIDSPLYQLFEGLEEKDIDY